jgi:hypothetical protein
MASGFKVRISGVDTDLDSIFKPRTSSATANTGFKSNGTDLAQLYEKIQYSPAQEISFDTKLIAGSWNGGGNTDLRYIFVNINYA